MANKASARSREGAVLDLFRAFSTVFSQCWVYSTAANTKHLTDLYHGHVTLLVESLCSAMVIGEKDGDALRCGFGHVLRPGRDWCVLG